MGKALPFILIPVLLLAVASSALAESRTVTETARSNDMVAAFSYTEKGPLEYSKLHLKITRGDVVMFDDSLEDACRSCKGAWPGGQGTKNSVSISLLSGDKVVPPEVVVDLYTGGAHCCIISLIYAYNATANTYRRVAAKNWESPSYTLKSERDSQPYFLTADGTFAYQFTSYADSVMPLETWALQSGKLVETTCDNLGLVREEAEGYEQSVNKELKSHGAGDSRGIFAALAADLYRLDQVKRANALANKLLKRKKFSGDRTWPHGKKYVKALKRFLKREGYDTPCPQTT